MKIEVDKVNEFLEAIKFLVEQINETLRQGWDNEREIIADQVTDITTKIDGFRVIELTPVSTTKQSKLQYLKDVERIDTKSLTLSAFENATIFKAQLYSYVWRELKKIPASTIAEVKADVLAMWIETNTIFNGSNTRYESLCASKEWFYTSQEVFNDVANEISMERNKNPQQALFQ